MMSDISNNNLSQWPKQALLLWVFWQCVITRNTVKNKINKTTYFCVLVSVCKAGSVHWTVNVLCVTHTQNYKHPVCKNKKTSHLPDSWNYSGTYLTTTAWAVTLPISYLATTGMRMHSLFTRTHAQRHLADQMTIAQHWQTFTSGEEEAYFTFYICFILTSFLISAEYISSLKYNFIPSGKSFFVRFKEGMFIVRRNHAPSVIPPWGLTLAKMWYSSGWRRKANRFLIPSEPCHELEIWSLSI